VTSGFSFIGVDVMSVKLSSVILFFSFSFFSLIADEGRLLGGAEKGC